ncbi:hypothetical protein B296_00037643 [Ensete ventricosum]|uniref:Uncharacterized protein n=1 Tax=Ensete ventricosum TaxID=4639 RepID=A0A426Y749_ENSVE|nr:hypothetical protein B296_00037643 [Ensete ventricosum]
MHALAGYSNPQTMKVGGLLKQQPITVLIDTSNTNNFLNSKVAARMALQIEGAWMTVEGVFGIAGREATLVLRASWFNRSSCNRAKEMAAISMYGCRAFTSPLISGFKPAIKLTRSVTGVETKQKRERHRSDRELGLHGKDGEGLGGEEREGGGGKKREMDGR